MPQMILEVAMQKQSESLTDIHKTHTDAIALEHLVVTTAERKMQEVQRETDSYVKHWRANQL
jgi:hypothetical protein